jgi:type IV fimbrial biogenesis protein FimT
MALSWIEIMRDSKMSKNFGFTLIELMVTITVLAILSVLAAPSFSSILRKQNLNQSARNLAVTLDAAKSKASIERREISILLNSSETNTENQLHWQASGESILLGTTTSLVFRTDGLLEDIHDSSQPLSSSLSLKLCDRSQSVAQYSKTVSIDRNGNIVQNPIAEGC